MDAFADLAGTVYPRSRGEHICNCGIATKPGGLSPLARGTHALVPAISPQHRFIPARAGNTSSGNPALSINSVYPRSRGEHSSRRRRTSFACGLSPLARGTLSYPPQFEPCARFIPARAGNTLKLYTCIYYTFSCNNILPTFGSQSRIVKERITY